MAAATSTRRQVLSIFKKILRTRQSVFLDDIRALNESRLKIKEEFLKHRRVTSLSEIKDLLKIAEESEEILRTQVIQAELVGENTYRLRPEHVRSKCVDAPRQKCENCTCGM